MALIYKDENGNPVQVAPASIEITGLPEGAAIRGPKGEDGAAGADGRDGADGADGKDGTDGAQGPQGVYYIDIYQNASTAPTSRPTGGSYVIATDTLTPPSGWTDDVEMPGDGELSYISRARVDPATQSGTITPTWSIPVEAGGRGPAGQDGADGADGVSPPFDITIYIASNNVPAKPTGGTYTVSTGTITPPSGWSATLVASTTTDRVYSAQARIVPASISTATVVPTWSDPSLYAELRSDLGTENVGEGYFHFTSVNDPPSTPRQGRMGDTLAATRVVDLQPGEGLHLLKIDAYGDGGTPNLGRTTPFIVDFSDPQTRYNPR